MADEEKPFIIQYYPGGVEEAASPFGKNPCEQNLVCGEKGQRMEVPLQVKIFLVIIMVNRCTGMILIENGGNMDVGVFRVR